jgi:hypothetical protein
LLSLKDAGASQKFCKPRPNITSLSRLGLNSPDFKKALSKCMNFSDGL